MDFQNSWFIYMLAFIIVGFISVQSIVFMLKAYKRGLALKMDGTLLKKTITSSIVFSIAPSIAILLTVITLAGALGLPFPYLRLSVIGAITYEIPAATAVSESMKMSLAAAASTVDGFATIAFVMTFGIIANLLLVPILMKKVLAGVDKIKVKDNKWSNIFMNSLFLGLISAFLGSCLSGITTDRATGSTIPATSKSIMVSVLTLITSAVFMLIIAVLVKKLKWKWLEGYAIPICMLVSMGMAVVYSLVLPL